MSETLPETEIPLKDQIAAAIEDTGEHTQLRSLADIIRGADQSELNQLLADSYDTDRTAYNHLIEGLREAEEDTRPKKVAASVTRITTEMGIITDNLFHGSEIRRAKRTGDKNSTGGVLATDIKQKAINHRMKR